MNFNHWFSLRLNSLGDCGSTSIKKVFEEFDQKLICPDFSNVDEFASFADVNFYIGSVKSSSRPPTPSWISRTKTNGFIVPNPLVNKAEHYICLWVKENCFESLNSFLGNDFKLTPRFTGHSVFSGQFNLVVPTNY